MLWKEKISPVVDGTVTKGTIWLGLLGEELPPVTSMAIDGTTHKYK
jgi:hypothetical protein